MTIVNKSLTPGGGVSPVNPRRRTLVWGLILVVLQVTSARAQTPNTETQTNAPATLDAVVVTANKRVENVQEVPKSVMVVTPETLSKSGVTTIRELGNLIPSLSTSSRERIAAPPIRGISSFSISIGVQTQTGIIIDDVPQASFSSLFKELTDIERVEVLAGPQSTLSGRNASGGLINIVTRAPSDTFSAEASFEQTSDRQQRFSAFLTGPLSQSLAFSLTAFSNEWEGNIKSLTETNGNRPLNLGGWDTQGARGKLRWQPNERLIATLTLYGMESLVSRVGSIPAGTYFHVDPQARYTSDTLDRSIQEVFPGLTPQPYNRWTGSPRHTLLDNRDTGGSLHIEYELDNAATLTSITSIAHAKTNRLDNIFAVPFTGMTFPDMADPYAYVDYDTQTNTQELRLASPSGQKFDYLVGLVYSDMDTRHPYERLGVLPVNWNRTFDMQSAAVFARGTWHLGARDALTVGIRHQRDDMGYSFAFLPLVANATVPDSIATGRKKYNFSSGELSWRHELAKEVSAWMTVSSTQSGEVYDLEDNRSAMEPGGLQPLDSQKVRNIEVGLKSQWWQRRLTMNVTAFLARYEQYHIQSREEAPNPNDPPIIKLFAIGEVQTRGVELETRLRATERLNLNLAAAWIDASIRDYPDGPCYPRQSAAQGCTPSGRAGVAGRQVDLAGNRMPNSPKFKLTSAANYFIPLNRLPFDVELGAAYRWQSMVQFDFRGHPDLVQGSYGVLNVSAALLDRDGRYSLSVFVNNLLDRNFYSNKEDNTRWSAPAYHGRFARDSFRYAGINLRVNF